jgi:arylsulfatase
MESSQQLYFIAPGQFLVAQWLETFKEFPPRQRPASFNVDDIVKKLTAPSAGR